MRANPIRDLASCASCYHLFNALSAPKSVKDVLRLNTRFSDVGLLGAPYLTRSLRQMWKRSTRYDRSRRNAVAKAEDLSFCRRS